LIVIPKKSRNFALYIKINKMKEKKQEEKQPTIRIDVTSVDLDKVETKKLVHPKKQERIREVLW